MLLPTPLARQRAADPGRRGAALMLALLVLLVLVLLVFQIKIASDTDARVGRNDAALTAMDSAIESALLQIYEDLALDAENDAAAEQEGAGPGGGDGANPFGSAMPGADGGEGGGDSPADSKEDDWARPQRQEINEVQLRVLIQDEESKYNLLALLTENEEEAEKAFERLIRILENARKGTKSEIEPGDARRMATEVREYLTRRRDQMLPKPELLSDDEENEDHGLPLTLREFVALDSWDPDHFRDFRDEDETVVHSLGSFLTVYTALMTADEAAEAAGAAGGDGTTSTADAPGSSSVTSLSADGTTASRPAGDGEGGGDDVTSTVGGPQSSGTGTGTGTGEGTSGPTGVAVNLNTSPPAVLKALMDDRDVPPQFWDGVIEFRNEEVERETGEEEDDPPLDEFGEPIVERKYFGSIEDLNQVDGWMDLEPIHQSELSQLLTTRSSVFSVYVTARRPTGEKQDAYAYGNPDPEAIREQEEDGTGLIRTVRCVVWRRARGDGTFDIVPIQRWEPLDYSPYEVKDFPDEDR